MSMDPKVALQAALEAAVVGDDELMEYVLDQLTAGELDHIASGAAFSPAVQRMTDFARRLAHAKRGHV
jgi:hypothetical protein